MPSNFSVISDTVNKSMSLHKISFPLLSVAFISQYFTFSPVENTISAADPDDNLSVVNISVPHFSSPAGEIYILLISRPVRFLSVNSCSYIVCSLVLASLLPVVSATLPLVSHPAKTPKHRSTIATVTKLHTFFILQTPKIRFYLNIFFDYRNITN